MRFFLLGVVFYSPEYKVVSAKPMKSYINVNHNDSTFRNSFVLYHVLFDERLNIYHFVDTTLYRGDIIGRRILTLFSFY